MEALSCPRHPDGGADGRGLPAEAVLCFFAEAAMLAGAEIDSMDQWHNEN